MYCCNYHINGIIGMSGKNVRFHTETLHIICPESFQFRIIGIRIVLTGSNNSFGMLPGCFEEFRIYHPVGSKDRLSHPQFPYLLDNQTRFFCITPDKYCIRIYLFYPFKLLPEIGFKVIETLFDYRRKAYSCCRTVKMHCTNPSIPVVGPHHCNSLIPFISINHFNKGITALPVIRNIA